jgi:hypothetical protein
VHRLFNKELEDQKHGGKRPPILERKFSMFYTIVVVLLILWLLGLVTSYTMGGFIHILLVIAIIVILLRVIRGRDMFGRKD